jgi:hypothetical protein
MESTLLKYYSRITPGVTVASGTASLARGRQYTSSPFLLIGTI